MNALLLTVLISHQPPVVLNPGEILTHVDGVPVTPVVLVPPAPVRQLAPPILQRAAEPRGLRLSSRARRWRIQIDPAVQTEAQREVALMARRGIRGHVGRTLGRFEGCGWSSGPNPPTCEPRRGMVLIAEATARGRGGYYRVRAWR